MFTVILTHMDELNLVVIDDNADDVAILNRTLTKVGRPFRLHHVNDGSLVNDTLGQIKPTHVVCDGSLLGCDVVQVRRMLDTHGLTETRVVAMSGRDDPEYVSRVLGAGATAFVSKQRLSDIVPVLLAGTYVYPHAVENMNKDMTNTHAASFGALMAGITVIPHWLTTFSDKVLIGASVALVSGFAYKAGAAGWDRLANAWKSRTKKG